MFSENGRLRARMTPAVLFAVALFSTAGAVAQQTTVIGQQQGGSVTVDTSVLNELGSVPNIPQLYEPSVRSLLMPNARMPERRAATAPNEETIRLRPPSERKRTTTTKRSTAPKRPTAARPPSRPATTAPMAVARPATPTAPPPPPVIAEAPKTGTSGSTAVMPPPAPPAVPAAPPETATAAPPAPPAPPPAPAAAPAAPPASSMASAPPAAPQPPAAPAARPSAVPRQTASLPPSGAIKVGQQIRLGFAANAVTLEDEAERQLDAIAKGLTANTDLRLQLLAYAGGAESASQARRLSLSRALAVRSHLIRKGVRSTNIDVRALGDKFEGGPPDRVDVIVTSR